MCVCVCAWVHLHCLCEVGCDEMATSWPHHVPYVTSSAMWSHHPLHDHIIHYMTTSSTITSSTAWPHHPLYHMATSSIIADGHNIHHMATSSTIWPLHLPCGHIIHHMAIWPQPHIPSQTWYHRLPWMGQRCLLQGHVLGGISHYSHRGVNPTCPLGGCCSCSWRLSSFMRSFGAAHGAATTWGNYHMRPPPHAAATTWGLLAPPASHGEHGGGSCSHGGITGALQEHG